MNEVLSVSQFVDVINFTLEALDAVTVQGEVDEFKIIHNKWVTFKLKDDKASVGCFMTVWQLRTQIEDGMLVKAVGQPKLREKGFFSFVLQDVQPAGEGALKRAFELLKEKLTAEGLFSPERKRPLPRFPQHIALITSRDAAAYSDFIKVLTGRQGGLTISFIHTQVQGEEAPQQIIRALETANTELNDVDVIVLVRGGGSLEDLHAFNDERVVRAVATSRTLTVVGIGHERDISLAELAADVRASTPSNAAELIVRSREELRGEIAYLQESLRRAVHEALQTKQTSTLRAVHALRTRLTSTSSQVVRRIDTLHSLARRYRELTTERKQNIIEQKRSLVLLTRRSTTQSVTRLQYAQRILSSLSPEHTLRRGYSITKDAAGKIIKDPTGIKEGEAITTSLARGTITSIVKKQLLR